MVYPQWQNLLSLGERCAMTKVLSPRSRSQCTPSQNPCPDDHSFMPCWIRIFHSIVHHKWPCVNLKPRQYIQGHNSNAIWHHGQLWAFKNVPYVPCVYQVYWCFTSRATIFQSYMCGTYLETDAKSEEILLFDVTFSDISALLTGK